MFKNTLKTLSLVVSLSAAFAAGAADMTGRWSPLPAVGDFKNVVEADGLTYFLSGPSLLSLSDDDSELYAFNASNKLTDPSTITGIWYNADSRYLVVAYESGNIDVLHADGSVVNMAEIKDAILNSTRGIRGVAFGHGRIYIATDFGLVVYDEKKHEVIESGIYNKPVDEVFVLGDKLLIAVEHSLLMAPFDIRHNTLDKFKVIAPLWSTDAATLGDDALVFSHFDNGKVYHFSINTESGTISSSIIDLDGERPRKVAPYSGGVYIIHGNNVTMLGADGSRSKIALPDGTEDVFIGEDLSSVWFATADGIMRADMTGDTPAVLMQPFKPEGVTTNKPASMVWSADASRLYIGNIGPTYFLSGLVGDGFEVFANTSYIEDGRIYDAMPAAVESENPRVLRTQKLYNTKRIVGGPSRPAIDPEDNSLIYLPVRSCGIFVIKDGEVIGALDSFNVPYESKDYSEDMYLATIDNQGNLWVSEGYSTPAVIKVLPAEKRRSKITDVDKSDWLTFKLPASFEGPNRDFYVTFCRKSNINVIGYGDWQKGFVVMDNNGTPNNFSDDRFVHHMTATDQSGAAINSDYFTCAVEDHDGKLWIGTSQGPVVVDNPADAMNPSLQVRRPIVPRHDGTQLGDYLLSTDMIYTIAIDPSNRKWVGTESSGAYLVSADGTEILGHFTTANSGLPSNTVYSIAPDPKSNKVYIGTSLGTVVYDSDSAPAADDYSEVYAYPNPVRPEYTGWITVAGLMDNSLVKIADAAGNVFFQGVSEGGMITWDGCDQSGKRVRTGVYFVFASQNASGSSSGAVTKIMVVN